MNVLFSLIIRLKTQHAGIIRGGRRSNVSIMMFRCLVQFHGIYQTGCQSFVSHVCPWLDAIMALNLVTYLIEMVTRGKAM